MYFDIFADLNCILDFSSYYRLAYFYSLLFWLERAESIVGTFELPQSGQEACPDRFICHERARDAKSELLSSVPRGRRL